MTGFNSLMVENTNPNANSSVNSASANGGHLPTDSTLTPTTLKSITQIFESQDCLNVINKIEDDGFAVPLPVTAASTKTSSNGSATATARKSYFNLDSKAWQGGTTTVVTPTSDLPAASIVDNSNTNAKMTGMRTRSSTREQTVFTNKRQQMIQQQQPAVIQQQQQQPKRKSETAKANKRSSAGLLRTHRIDEDDLTPDEAERLRVRRERNKAAAARCRKRRVDQINTLSAEVEQWEGKKRIMEETIRRLKEEKSELEYILAQHQPMCKLGLSYQNGFQAPAPTTTTATIINLPVAVKSEPVIVEPMEQVYMVQQPLTVQVKPKRPLSLKIEKAKAASALNGVEIDTPSSVIPSLGFDTLMTSTGLTPTTNIATPVSFAAPVNCSSQQRSSETLNTTTLDLNTPSGENVSLVSL